MAIDKLGQNAIADGSVDTAQLVDDSVNSAKIGVDVIAAEDLAANSVTVTEISNGAITTAKMNGLTGSSSGILQADGDGSLSTTTSRVAVSGDTMTGALEIDITGNGDGAIQLNAGDDATPTNKAQIKLGHNGTQNYPHFISTRHNSSAANNAISFSVSDGTQSAVLGTDTKEVLRLDGTGAVYKPNNPVLKWTTQGISHSGGDGATVTHTFSTTGGSGAVNIGGWSVNGSGEMVVPADGVYDLYVHFDAAIGAGGHNIRAGAVRLLNNGVRLVNNQDNWWNETSGYSSNYHFNWHTKYITSLSQGDRLTSDTQVYHNTSSPTYGGMLTLFAQLIG